MSEWIDLGKVSLESDNSQRGILTRVHDAESQLLTNNTTTTTSTTTSTTTTITTTTSITNNTKHNDTKPTISPQKSIIKNIPKPVVKEPTPKRPTIVRSASENSTVAATAMTRIKPERRSSWLGGLFQQDKKKKSGIHGNTTTSPLSGLATLFSKSLSIKSVPLVTAPVRSRSPSPPTTPSPPPPNIQDKKPSRLEQRTRFNANRLPLHVERAIYRLSHMKLADPKRPLRQQVLISNLMFWYLSIQQGDFQRNEEEECRLVTLPLSTVTITPVQEIKKFSKMTRLIHSAKKRKNEVSQFVQLNEPQTPRKPSNVQFSLAPIPSHHHPVLNFEEEDDVPLSRYKSG